MDAIMAERASYRNVVKSVTVDIVARVLMTSTEQEPMVQSSESALGYSFSGTFLVPGGGLFIKNSELSRLGLRRQRYGVINLYDTD
ncbi:phage Gp19/Gp15/Gp42 family protein [Erysipelothrix sp. D19-032]